MYRIIIPTLEKPHLKTCLSAIKKHTSQEHSVTLITEGDTWAEAVNIGINKFPDEDIILMDDDIIVTEGWLDNIEEYKEKADIIGWSLQRLDGSMQFTGCYFYKNAFGKYIMGNYTDVLTKPKYTPNTTTSLCYIKRKVFNKIGLLDNETYKDGCHYEDSDFCMRAVSEDFRILVVPEIVVHGETLTKKDFVAFKERVARNAQIFYTKLNNNDEWKEYCERRGFINVE